MSNFCLCPALCCFRGLCHTLVIVAHSFADSIGGPFPVTSHRRHHKQEHCAPGPPGGGLPATPLLFHPHTKGSQILMDLSHKAVKRQASFCNAITFSNRPVLIYEQVRLKVGLPSLLSAHPGDQQCLPLPLHPTLLVLCAVTRALPHLPRAGPSYSSFLNLPSGTEREWGRGVAVGTSASCHQPVGRFPEEREEACRVV